MMNNNIPQGYKQSPLGVIPQDWEVRRLGEVCTHFKSGLGITADNIAEVGEYPVYGGNGLRGYCDSYTHDGDYVLIGRQGALCGNINFTSGKSYISEHAIAVQVDGNIHWLKYKLDYWNLNRFSESSAQPGLSVEKLVRYKLTVPPLAEQEGIAEVLGTWDEAIDKQSQLVKALERRKRALMQQLLTARKRLANFSAPWQTFKLGKLGTTYNGLTGKTKDDFDCGDANYVTYMNVFSNGTITSQLLGKVDVNIEESQNAVRYGDIFFTVSSETPKEVGMSSVLLTDVDNTYLNSFCFGYRLSDFNTLLPEFAQYLFRGAKFRKVMSIIAQGSTRYNISKGSVLELLVSLPPLEEQKAIAQILTTADKEIELATKKLETLRIQKRALMQQLLTGKKRLKI